MPVLSDENMPLGLQMMGKLDEDAALFGLAAGVLSILERNDVIGAA
mgnify:FL=1